MLHQISRSYGEVAPRKWLSFDRDFHAESYDVWLFGVISRAYVCFLAFNLWTSPKIGFFRVSHFENPNIEQLKKLENASKWDFCTHRMTLSVFIIHKNAISHVFGPCLENFSFFPEILLVPFFLNF